MCKLAFTFASSIAFMISYSISFLHPILHFPFDSLNFIIANSKLYCDYFLLYLFRMVSLHFRPEKCQHFPSFFLSLKFHFAQPCFAFSSQICFTCNSLSDLFWQLLSPSATWINGGWKKQKISKKNTLPSTKLQVKLKHTNYNFSFFVSLLFLFPTFFSCSNFSFCQNFSFHHFFSAHFIFTLMNSLINIAKSKAQMMITSRSHFHSLM